MQIFFISRIFRLFLFIAIIARLKSIRSLIESSVILASIFGLSFLPILDNKNINNVLEFDLISKNEDFPYDRVLLVWYWLDGNGVVVEATELVWQGNQYFS